MFLCQPLCPTLLVTFTLASSHLDLLTPTPWVFRCLRGGWLTLVLAGKQLQWFYSSYQWMTYLRRSCFCFWEKFSSRFKKNKTKMLWTELCPLKFIYWSSDTNVPAFAARASKEVIKFKWGHSIGPYSNRPRVLLSRVRDTRDHFLHRSSEEMPHKKAVRRWLSII